MQTVSNADNLMAALLVAERQRDDLLEAARCAIAALSQHKTFPADIALAKNALSNAIDRTQKK